MANMPVSEMRILALMGSVLAYGSERANLETLAALRDQGAQVLLLVSDAEYAFEFRDYAVSRGFDICPAPCISPPRSYSKTRPIIDLPVGIARASIAFLKVHKAFKPTHIHAANQLFILNVMPALAMVKTPLVYRCGDAPIQHNAVWRATWRFINRRAARFGAVSRYIAERMVDAGTPREKITVVYSRPPRRNVAPARARREATLNIGFVGQVIAEKGVGLLVEAFEPIARAFPEARLLIAGRIWEDWDGEPWGKALRDLTLANPALVDRVEFLGFVEDIPGFLARCAVLVAPTLKEEPMGNVVMEAKQAGVPSIIFRSGGFPEVIQHGVTGYVCAEKSAAALTEAMATYLRDPAAAKRQGKAARQSLKKFGVDDFDAHWAAIYQQAAA